MMMLMMLIFSSSFQELRKFLEYAAPLPTVGWLNSRADPLTQIPAPRVKHAFIHTPSGCHGVHLSKAQPGGSNPADG